MPGVVDLWLVRPAPGDPVPATLSRHERARVAALHRTQDRSEHAAAAHLVRVVAGRVLGVDPAAVPVVRACATCGGPHGRPVVPGGPQLSVSHAGGLVAVAAGEEAVGVDVEPWHRAAAMAEIRSLLVADSERLPTDETGADLLRRWVRTEAVLKAGGRGLAEDPRALRFDPRGSGGALVTGPGAGTAGSWVVDVDVPGYAVAVAVGDPARPAVHVRDATALLTTRG